MTAVAVYSSDMLPPIFLELPSNSGRILQALQDEIRIVYSLPYYYLICT